jgi:hypothetical protein
MKIFIAGPRAIKQFDTNVTAKLLSIYEKGYDVLVGDAAGVDSAVQGFYADKGYRKVTVFASNGVARNNVGNWNIENIPVDGSLRGFDFYKHKDLAMASATDYGLMVWNGESKGTLNNIINLLEQEKICSVYLVPRKKFITIDNEETLLRLLSLCSRSANEAYQKLKRTTQPTQIVLF